MSGTPVIPLAAAPVALPAVAIGVAGAAVAAAGALLYYGIGKGVADGCRNVYKICKEGKYPVDRLQVIHTPITNFSGLEEILGQGGFTISPFGQALPLFTQDNPTQKPHTPGISTACKAPQCDMAPINLAVATNKWGENVILVHGDSGIALISENIPLMQSTIQDFGTNEIVNALKSNDFQVTVEKVGEEKRIVATDTQKNTVSVTIPQKGKDGTIDMFIDSRKTRKPKCDVIHQIIQAKLKERKAVNETTRKKADSRARVRM